jgi:acetyltransferase EpsM
MNQKVLIWGASGHAKVAADILISSGHEIAGFIDELNPGRRKEKFYGSLVYDAGDDLIRMRESGVNGIFIGFGHNHRRVERGIFAESLGFTLVNAIHSTAVVALDVVIGAGTLLAAGAIVNPGSTIGRLAILNTAATVDHDCTLEDGVHVSPGVHIAGNVRIGRCSWLGIGSTVIENISIGSNSIVGAGAVVIKNVQDSVLVVGVPARTIKKIF